MRLKHLLFAVPLSLALTAATPLAYADDEAPAPKKVRVRLKRSPAKDAAAAGRKTKSPMGVIRTWLMGKMGESLAGGGAQGDRLAAWFDGGADVPLAGLRDALKADGWTAPTLKMWMMGEMARVGPQMMQLFASRGGERGHGSRTFTLFGQQDEAAHPGMPHGFFLGQGARHGQGMPHGMGMRGHGTQGRGMQAGPGGRHGFHPGHARRGGQSMRRRGMRGRGMRRNGMRGHGFQGSNAHGQGGMPFGGMGQPRMQARQRTIILWNDGSGWQQKTIPGGMPGMGRGHGSHPMMHPGMRSMMQGVPGMHGAPGMGWMPGHPGKAGKPGTQGGHGTHGSHGKHGMGGRHGSHGHGKTGAHGPMGHGAQGSPDLGALLKMFGGLQGPEGAKIDGATLETLFKALKQHGVELGIDARGLTPTAPKKVRIRVQKPKSVKVIEQVEIVK